MDIPDLTPLQWALVVGLLLLAIAGIYHIAVRLAGYKVLPMYQPRACGGPPHQLAYITEKERFDLIEAGGEGVAKFGTQGVPCYTNDWNFTELPERLAAHERNHHLNKLGKYDTMNTPDDAALDQVKEIQGEEGAWKPGLAMGHHAKSMLMDEEYE